MLEVWVPVKVYLEDTDAQGVVYNASYFRFMERARSEFLRAYGFDHDALRSEHSAMVVLTSIDARFRTPARLSDQLHVGAGVVSIRGARMVFQQSVCRDAPDGELLCECRAEVACMDTRHGKPKRFPRELVGGIPV